MKQTLGLVIIVAALTYAAASAGQEVRPVPGPGTGIVRVQGTVDVGNAVTVQQGSDWRVSLSGVPDVRVYSTAPLEFLRARRRYQITWAPGQSEDVTVEEVGSWAWVRVGNANGRRRWINLARAQEVAELEAGGR